MRGWPSLLISHCSTWTLELPTCGRDMCRTGSVLEQLAALTMPRPLCGRTISCYDELVHLLSPSTRCIQTSHSTLATWVEHQQIHDATYIAPVHTCTCTALTRTLEHGECTVQQSSTQRIR